MDGCSHHFYFLNYNLNFIFYIKNIIIEEMTVQLNNSLIKAQDVTTITIKSACDTI